MRGTHCKAQHLCHCISDGIVVQLRAGGTNSRSKQDKTWKLSQDYPEARDLAKQAIEPTRQASCCGPVLGRLYFPPVLPAISSQSHHACSSEKILSLCFSFWREMMAAVLPALLSEIGKGILCFAVHLPFLTWPFFLFLSCIQYTDQADLGQSILITHLPSWASDTTYPNSILVDLSFHWGSLLEQNH